VTSGVGSYNGASFGAAAAEAADAAAAVDGAGAVELAAFAAVAGCAVIGAGHGNFASVSQPPTQLAAITIQATRTRSRYQSVAAMPKGEPIDRSRAAICHTSARTLG
jgi:hypothetical protein